MGSPLHLSLICQVLAATLSMVSFTRRSMMPLRIFAIGSNVFFVAYAFLDEVWPVFLLHLCLLPLNIKRLAEIRKLTAEIKKAAAVSDIAQSLLPHMVRRPHQAGDILFRKGDIAYAMFYIAAGKVRIEGLAHVLGAGDLIGEIALFSPDKKRTQTLICDTDCELYTMTDDMMFRLYYQDPSLGFYFMKLVVGRLQRDIEREQAARAAAC